MINADLPKRAKDRPAFIRGITMSDVKRFNETVDKSKYAATKKPRIVKANPFAY
jgi:hypothetical protein